VLFLLLLYQRSECEFSEAAAHGIYFRSVIRFAGDVCGFRNGLRAPESARDRAHATNYAMTALVLDQVFSIYFTQVKKRPLSLPNVKDSFGIDLA
jgi:hypothetical protein